MRDFRKLEIWKDSHKMALRVYQITRQYPSDEKFGLISQMRNSAAAVPTNISEGCGRSTEKELARFCDIAMGSASELEYQFILSNDLGYINEETFNDIETELVTLKKRLNKFISRLRNS